MPPKIPLGQNTKRHEYVPKQFIVKEVKVLTDYERYLELDEKFKAGEVTGFVAKKVTYRLFTNNGNLCYFKKGSGKRGFLLNSNHIIGFEKYIFKKEKDPDYERWKIIDKYRRYASEATFTNSFIRSCIELPKTFEQWITDGKKCLYEYHITTGVAKEGEVVTVGSWEYHNLAEKIASKVDWNSGRYDFRNYDGSVSFKNYENGDFMGWLNLEFRGCGNGHYYLLINDTSFIYYDKD